MNEAIHLLNRRNPGSSEADGLHGAPPSLRAVAVQFLSHGRNAWHSTWVSRYGNGAFFRDGWAVRNAVEKRKERGTVFYLTVLPGFQIGYGNRSFILTEINTSEPFRHMNLMAAQYGLKNYNGLMSYDLTGFLEVIAPPSSLWKGTQSPKNSIIVQEVRQDFIEIYAYEALSARSDGNRPIGHYERSITGSSFGVSDWDWTRARAAKPISLRWYNKALKILVENRERRAHHLIR